MKLFPARTVRNRIIACLIAAPIGVANVYIGKFSDVTAASSAIHFWLGCGLLVLAGYDMTRLLLSR